MTAKEYIQELGIEDETIYDNAERMHSLECLLENYHQSQLKLLGLHDVVGRSEQLKAEQEAYNSGYNDGAQAAATDILG